MKTKHAMSEKIDKTLWEAAISASNEVLNPGLNVTHHEITYQLAKGVWAAQKKIAQLKAERDDWMKKAIDKKFKMVNQLKAENAELKKRVEELETLVSKSAPLAWVNNGDDTGAHLWEIEAFELVSKKCNIKVGNPND